MQQDNSYVIISTDTNIFAIEASGDRVIIEEDKFKTGYECKDCDGERFSRVSGDTCGHCNGSGRTDEVELCRSCEGTGKSWCRTCKGKGGSLIVPETAARRPTSGVIRSIGRDANTDEHGVKILGTDGQEWLRIGDRVLYPIFAGTAIEFRRGVCRILHRNEIMSKVYGVGDIGKEIR